MTGRVRRLACAPPSLGDFVAGAPASPVGGLDAPPCLGDFVRWRSGISRRLALRTSFSPRFRSLALRHLPPPAAGRCKSEKENQRSSELDADFLFPVCGEKEIRTPDTLLEYTRFPGVPLKPLEHLSRTAL